MEPIITETAKSTPMMITFRRSLRWGGRPRMAAGMAPMRRFKPFSTSLVTMTMTATVDMTAPKAALRQLQTMLRMA